MNLPTISKSKLLEVIEASHPVANLLMLRSISSHEKTHCLSDLLLKMQSTGFTSPFDWQEEFGSDMDRLNDIEVVKSADLENLRKIITAHIRIDRMSDGHLDSLIQSGYLNACWARLDVLIETMKDDE